jgi:hypothetical protein
MSFPITFSSEARGKEGAAFMSFGVLIALHLKKDSRHLCQSGDESDKEVDL